MRQLKDCKLEFLKLQTEKTSSLTEKNKEASYWLLSKVDWDKRRHGPLKSKHDEISRMLAQVDFLRVIFVRYIWI